MPIPLPVTEIHKECIMKYMECEKLVKNSYMKIRLIKDPEYLS